MAGAAVIVLGLVLAMAIARDVANQVGDRRSLSRLTAEGPAPGEGPESPPGPVERCLRAAGLRVSSLTYLSASALLALLVLLGLQSALPELPLAAMAGAAGAAYVPWTMIKSRGKRRARRFEAGLVDAVGFLVGALKAGENLTQAFASAAEASAGVVRREFGEVADKLRLGMSVRRALKRITEGYTSSGTRLFTQTLIAKQQAGGDLVPVLESINQVLRERLQLRWRVQSHLAGARMAAAAVAVIPYILLPFYFWQQPGWLDKFREHPLGLPLLLGAVTLQFLGVLWMRRLMKIEM